MRILVMIVTHKLDNEKYIDNIKSSFENADFALISSVEYKGSSEFKYKFISPNYQLAKICEFLSTVDETYDWYVKIRSEIEIKSCINFQNLSTDAMNARCRSYVGNKSIPFGSSLGGIFENEHDKSIMYDPFHESIVLDDQLYIFHRNVFEKIAYSSSVEKGPCSEWCHTIHWLQNGIKLNPVGFDINFHHPELGIVTSNHINC